MPSPETAFERAEELAARLLPGRTPKRRMLVIVNPYVKFSTSAASVVRTENVRRRMVF